MPIAEQGGICIHVIVAIGETICLRPINQFALNWKQDKTQTVIKSDP